MDRSSQGDEQTVQAGDKVETVLIRPEDGRSLDAAGHDVVQGARRVQPGLVMMAVVLGAVGLPLEGVGMILAVDRILDMCRTTVNVFSDGVDAATVARLEGEPVTWPEPGSG